MGSTLLKRTLGASLLAATLLAAGAAHADGAGDAERLFREGVKLRDAGDFTSACPKFADSFALDPAPGTLVNLGDCEVRIGKLTAAIEHYKLAVAGFPKGDKRRDLVAQKATAVEPKLAHLTIKLAPTVPETARITRAGAPFDRKESGVAVTMDPGSVSIVVTAPDRQDATYPITLGEGESKEATVDVGAPVEKKAVATPASNKAAPASTPASAPPSGNGMKTAGYVAGGIGLVSLGVGTVTGIMAMGKANDVKQHCDTQTYACDSTGVEAAHAGNTLAPVSTVTLIAGAVLVAGGVTLVVISGKKKEPQVSFVPAFGPSGGGGSVVGRF